MKVFIPGGAGFIGTHLCKKLLTQNYDVTVYDNFSNSSRENVEFFKMSRAGFAESQPHDVSLM